MHILKTPQKTKDALGIAYGVVVGGVSKGKFKDAGIANGFIVQEINEQKVNSQSDVESIYNAIMRDSSADKVMYIKGLLLLADAHTSPFLCLTKTINPISYNRKK